MVKVGLSLGGGFVVLCFCFSARMLTVCESALAFFLLQILGVFFFFVPFFRIRHRAGALVYYVQIRAGCLKCSKAWSSARGGTRRKRSKDGAEIRDQ